ncbi:MAG: O-antigen/teichoic acid export membrane protein [Crocinitomicaceae bacterium]|jgi:O-antigen/teichoic acid export membrane protein
MGIVQKDAFRTMVISYSAMVLGYVNKVVLFLLIFSTPQIGLINLIIAVGFLFAQFANFGMLYAIWRFLPFFKNKEKSHNGILPLVLLIALAGVFLCSIGVIVLRPQIESVYAEKSPMIIDYYYWILPIGISVTFYQVLDVYLRGFYKNIISVIAFELVIRILVSCLLAIIAFDLISFDQFIVLHSLIYVVPAIILLMYLRGMGELNLRFSTIRIPKRFQKIMIQFSLFNYFNSMGATLVASLDLIMIAQYIGLQATGVYSIVVFLVSALSLPSRSIVRVASPLIADYWKHRKMDDMKGLYQNVSSVSLVIGLGLFTVVWLNIDFLFSFLNYEFKEGIWIFFFLMMGKLIDMYFGVNGAIFTTSKKYKYDIFFTLFLIGAVFGLNYYFIPWWGAPGAAISTAMALIVYNVSRLIFVWTAFKIHPFHKNQFIVLGLGLITIFTGQFIGGFISHEWLRVGAECLLIGVLYIAPIYLFSLESQTVGMIKKGIRFIRERSNGK